MNKKTLKHLVIFPCLFAFGCAGIEKKLNELVDKINKNTVKIKAGEVYLTNYQGNNISNISDNDSSFENIPLKSGKDLTDSLQDAFNHQSKQVVDASIYKQVEWDLGFNKLFNMDINLKYKFISNSKSYLYGILKADNHVIGESFLILETNSNRTSIAIASRVTDKNGKDIVIPMGATFSTSNINLSNLPSISKKLATMNFSIQQNIGKLRFSVVNMTLKNNTKKSIFIGDIDMLKLHINSSNLIEVETLINSILIANFLAS